MLAIVYHELFGLGKFLKKPDKLLFGKRTGYLIGKLPIFKEEEGGDTFDPVLGGCRLIAAGVELGNDNSAVKFPGHAVYNRCEHPAWATCW